MLPANEIADENLLHNPPLSKKDLSGKKKKGHNLRETTLIHAEVGSSSCTFNSHRDNPLQQQWKKSAYLICNFSSRIIAQNSLKSMHPSPLASNSAMISRIFSSGSDTSELFRA